jgi:hypothetical protein
MGEPIEKIIKDDNDVAFERVLCPECGIEFYVRSEWLEVLCDENIEREDKAQPPVTFRCPNSHVQNISWDEPDEDDDDDDDDGEEFPSTPPSHDVPDFLPVDIGELS